jgi:hypothetical protein
MISPKFKEDVLSRWQGLDANTRKLTLFWPGLLLLALLATSPLSCHRLRSASAVSQPVAVDLSQPQAAPAPTVYAAAPQVAGSWRGSGSVDKQGLCTFSMEIREQQQGRFLSYPQIACLSPGSQQRTVNPSSAVMSGAMKDNLIAFQVDAVTSTNEMGCTLAAPLVVRAFGSNQVAVDWKDSCGGGKMLLTRQTCW